MIRLCLSLSVLLSAYCLTADTLVTRDGRTLEGRLSFLPNALKVGETAVPLTQIRRAERTQTQAPQPQDAFDRLTAGLMAIDTAGALSRSGTFIAFPVVGMDDTKVTFQGDLKEVQLSTANTALIAFGALSYMQTETLRRHAPGVLLAQGDFIEGRNLQITNGRVQLDSILFGRKSFAIGSEAKAVWLQLPKADANQYCIRLREGSVILTSKFTMEAKAIVFNQVPMRGFRVPTEAVLTLQYGEVEDLLTQAWHKVQRTPDQEKPLLLAQVQNISRLLEVRSQLAVLTPRLEAAQKAEVQTGNAREASTQTRDQAKITYDQHIELWKVKNQFYTWEKAAHRRRMADVRECYTDVRNIDNRLQGLQRQLKTHDRVVSAIKDRLQTAEGNARIPLNSQLKATEKRAAKAKMDWGKLNEKKAELERRKIQAIADAEAANEKSKAVKVESDRLYRLKEDAQAAHVRALDAYRMANKAYWEAFNIRAQLQKEHGALVAEQVRLQPSLPNAN